MNTERVAVLQKVREALNAVLDEINSIEEPKAPSLKSLFALRKALRDQEEQLMNDDLRESAEEMTQAANDLQTLIGKMKKADAKLTAVADVVEKAAEAIKILAQIAVLAAKLVP
jgi:chromosome segregation ATPase